MPTRRFSTSRALLAAGLAVLASCLVTVAQPHAEVDMPEVDTALVVSVDISNSVDDKRYKLQMEGIAQALEDPAVISAILNGPQGGILLSVVTWADKARIAVPWTMIKSKEDAMTFAARVRKLTREGGEFTCLSGMLRTIADKVVTQIPGKPARIIVDVSGDGSDNCNNQDPLEAVREELVGSGVTINGLPILEGNEAATLEQWYKDNVKAGLGAFVLPADGFKDFGRAIRQKFVIEISGVLPGSHHMADGKLDAAHPKLR